MWGMRGKRIVLQESKVTRSEDLMYIWPFGWWTFPFNILWKLMREFGRIQNTQTDFWKSDHKINENLITTEHINKIHLHNSVLPVFALLLWHHVTAGFMSPSCPFAFVWPSLDPPCPLSGSQGGSPASAAPPGRCLRPRGSCRRSWCCPRETSPSLLCWRREDEEGREPGSCTLIGWGGCGAGRSVQLWCWCRGRCWWRDWSSQTCRRERGRGCLKAMTVEWWRHLVEKLTKGKVGSHCCPVAVWQKGNVLEI